MGLLAGKVALITGGNSGIGLASAKLFVAEGARVAIVGRRRSAVEEAVKEIGPSATLGLQADVSNPQHHDHIAQEVRRKFGGLDIYMANAGVNMIQSSSQVTEADYDEQFSTNTRGVFFGVQKSLPIMRDGGAIIITGSIASEKVLEGHAVYAGSKAAINAFARNWAVELKSRLIRVNVLSPGPTNSAILDKLRVPLSERSTFEKRMADAIPLGRMGQPEEIANAALFLASDNSSFITGINISIDGGMLVF